MRLADAERCGLVTDVFVDDLDVTRHAHRFLMGRSGYAPDDLHLDLASGPQGLGLVVGLWWNFSTT